ncbi:MAG: hypothetical protein Q8P92_03815 [Candidatus Daviesbacteria bacterium]|nr:hypothetical protein [Candidatus Daviesbacteria bacterium]
MKNQEQEPGSISNSVKGELTKRRAEPFGDGIDKKQLHPPEGAMQVDASSHSEHGFLIANRATRTVQGFVTDEGIWLTLSAAAKSLGYEVSSLERLARTGRIDALRLDRLWLINIDRFSAYQATKIRAGRPIGRTSGQ